MKIKRFVAPDMRQALRMIREALGDDAVILSNKSVPQGIELTAAVDLIAADTDEDSPEPAAPEASPVAKQRRGAQAVTREQPPSTEAIEAMRQEMHELRRWMQAELSTMSWHDLGQRNPHAQELIRRLMGLGISAELARSLAERLHGVDDIELAWRKALFNLAGELHVMHNDVLDQGGVIALVGPTGVGKTTTIAKMAARYALRNGHRHVALITTDNFRIGARDQLQTYGRILNVPVRNVADPDDMAGTLSALSDRRLILVDTAGVGGDDARFIAQLETLGAAGRSLTTLLTLSATTEATALEQTLRTFNVANPHGCVLTKLDEACSLGGALSVLAHNGLPLAYTTDGQRVPEDLQLARAKPLVERAESLFEQHQPSCDQTYIALTYGSLDANAHV